MLRKNRLLSIGDMSKFTGASIKSLRYYDRIKLLQPAYVDPQTNYRYYTFEQLYFVEIIMLCIEMDVPLKQLNQFIDSNETLDNTALLAYGKTLAQAKLEKLQNGLQFINTAERKIAETAPYSEVKGVYMRVVPEKYCYVIPHGQPLDKADLLEISQEHMKMAYDDDDYLDLPDFGAIYEYLPEGIKRYLDFADKLAYRR